jgi:hypothetical protein
VVDGYARRLLKLWAKFNWSALEDDFRTLAADLTRAPLVSDSLTLSLKVALGA